MGPIVLLIPIVIYLVLARWERRIKARMAEAERAEFDRGLDRLETFGPTTPVIDLVAAPSDPSVERRPARRAVAA